VLSAFVGSPLSTGGTTKQLEQFLETESNESCLKHWEIIADNLSKAGWSWNLSKAGWSWGCVATVDREGRTIFVADAHRDNGKRFVARSDEKLTAFLELERVTRESLRFLNAVRL
jgi:hypothetical protein